MDLEGCLLCFWSQIQLQSPTWRQRDVKSWSMTLDLEALLHELPFRKFLTDRPQGGLQLPKYPFLLDRGYSPHFHLKNFQIHQRQSDSDYRQSLFDIFQTLLGY